MQSSDNKFYFNVHNFDDEVIDEEEVQEEEPPPPPPTFSEAELDQAKQEAFAKGKAEGVTEEKASRSQAISKTLEKIAYKTETLFAQEAMREKLYEREAVALSLAIFEKLFPVFRERFGFDEFKHQLESILKSQEGQNSIRIKVSAGYADEVQALLDKLGEKNQGMSFKAETDENLAEGDVVLSWEDGGAIRKTQDIAEQIRANLQELLAGLDTNRHDTKEVDSPEDATNASAPALPTSGTDPQQNNDTALSNPDAEVKATPDDETAEDNDE